MSIESVLFKSFNLPTKGKVKANYNSFTKKLDGNIDTNNDGKLDAKDKNGYIEPAELFEELFNNQATYNKQLKALYKAGLEDPLEITPEIKAFVRKLIVKYKPNSDLEKTILLYRAIIPAKDSFNVNGNNYNGLKMKDGGLEIPYNSEFSHIFRRFYGGLRPKEILSLKPGKKIAQCVEYSFILSTLLIEAGIKASARIGATHTYLIATINDQNYKLDPTFMTFRKTDEKPASIRETVSGHYNSETIIRSEQKDRSNEASSSAYIAALIDPYGLFSLSNYAEALTLSRKFQEAKIFFEKALKIHESDFYSWDDYGTSLYYAGEFQKAINCFDKSLKKDPNNPLAWFNKGSNLYELKKYEEALDCVNKTIKLEPKDFTAWQMKYYILMELGRFKEAHKFNEEYEKKFNKK